MAKPQILAVQALMKAGGQAYHEGVAARLVFQLLQLFLVGLQILLMHSFFAYEGLARLGLT